MVGIDQMLCNVRISWEIYVYRSIFNFRDTVISFYVSIQYADGRLQEKMLLGLLVHTVFLS